MDKNKNEKNAAICYLLEQLQAKVYKLKLLFDDIILDTEDRIKLETEFRKECFGVTSTTWEILEKIGNWTSCCGVPPEQLGKPPYQPHEVEGDVSGLESFVKSKLNLIKDEYLSSGKIRIVDKDNIPVGETYPDTTKEQWLESANFLIERYKKEFANHEEDTKKNPDTNFPLPIWTPNVFIDEEIVNAAKGFMAGPVGMFRNKAVVAENQVFKNIHELRTFIIDFQCKTKDMVLYMTYTRDRQDFGNRDPFKMTPEERENAPRVTVYGWRGAFVNRDI